jgi:hypothetical protein
MKPPDHLRGPTKRWFADVCRDYVLEDHHIRLLACSIGRLSRVSESFREVLMEFVEERAPTGPAA